MGQFWLQKQSLPFLFFSLFVLHNTQIRIFTWSSFFKYHSCLSLLKLFFFFANTISSITDNVCAYRQNLKLMAGEKQVTKYSNLQKTFFSAHVACQITSCSPRCDLKFQALGPNGQLLSN